MEIDGVEFKKVASVGAGVIGYGHALKFAMAGLDVWAQNRTAESSELARERVAASLEPLVKNGVYAQDEAEWIPARIHYTTSIPEAVAGAQFVQESSAEHYEVKWGAGGCAGARPPWHWRHAHSPLGKKDCLAIAVSGTEVVSLSRQRMFNGRN